MKIKEDEGIQLKVNYYDSISYFSEGLACVSKGTERYFINTKGEKVFDFYLKYSINEIDTLEKLINLIEIYKNNSFDIEKYYDLIINDNVITFATKEEREQFKKEFFIEEVTEEEIIKCYVKSAKY